MIGTTATVLEIGGLVMAILAQEGYGIRRDGAGASVRLGAAGADGGLSLDVTF